MNLKFKNSLVYINAIGMVLFGFAIHLPYKIILSISLPINFGHTLLRIQNNI